MGYPTNANYLQTPIGTYYRSFLIPLPPELIKNYDEKNRLLLDQWAKWDSFRLSQLTDNSWSIRKRATSESPWIGTLTGVRSPGFAFVGDVSGGLGVRLKDFWQSYPSTIEINKARSSEAELTMWLWSPEAEPMNLCHYDTIAHNLNASYEDVKEGMSTPYGIARTSVITLTAYDEYPGSVHRRCPSPDTDICRRTTRCHPVRP